MSMKLADIEILARMLPPEERARLIESLLESLRDTHIATIEAEWHREISARVAAFQRGEVKTISAEEVFAQARRIAL